MGYCSCERHSKGKTAAANPTAWYRSRKRNTLSDFASRVAGGRKARSVRAEKAEVPHNQASPTQQSLPRVRPLTKKLNDTRPRASLPSRTPSSTLGSLRGASKTIPYIQKGWVPDGEEGAPRLPRSLSVARLGLGSEGRRQVSPA